MPGNISNIHLKCTKDYSRYQETNTILGFNLKNRLAENFIHWKLEYEKSRKMI